MTAPDPRIPDSELSPDELEARYPDDPIEPVLTEREQLIEELATADEAREDEIARRLVQIQAEEEAAQAAIERQALVDEYRNAPGERQDEIRARLNELEGAEAPELSEDLAEGTPLPYSTDKEYGRLIGMTQNQAKKDVSDVRAGRVPMSDARRERLEELAALRDDPARHNEAVQRIHALTEASRNEIDFGAMGNAQVTRQYVTPEGDLRIESTSDLGEVVRVDYTPDEVRAAYPDPSDPFGTRPSAPLVITNQAQLEAALEAAGTDPMALRRVLEANPVLYRQYRAGFDVAPSGSIP